MNIIGHEIVIISVGAWELRRGQTDVAVVLPGFVELWDAVLSSEVKRELDTRSFLAFQNGTWQRTAMNSAWLSIKVEMTHLQVYSKE